MGRGLAMAFPGLGAAVVAMDVDVAAGEALRAQANVEFLPCDVADEQSVNRAFDAAVARLGGLDVLIHAAGISPPANVETTLDLWTRVMTVNATGTFLTNYAAARHFRAGGGGGQILNFGSATGLVGYAEKPSYAASKGAIAAFTRSVAMEWGRDRITVNAILPAIKTPMYEARVSVLSAQEREDLRKAWRIPLGDAGEIDRDLVPVMAFFSSPGAAFITGQMIPVDGGAVMVR